MVDEINPTLPEGMEMFVSVDFSVFTEEAIKEVWITMAISLGLVALVNILFLGSWRSAIIPTIVAPICILSTFIVLAAFGFSINLLTLLALVLAIGLVVDDAIVMMENIFRHVESGIPPIQAALKGSKEIGFAVVSMTLTLIAVYAPIASTSASRVSVLMLKPKANISANAPTSATGMVTSGIIIARNERRNRRMISTTSTTASAMVV